MWTKCMAEEGENVNISALAIAPGIVDTGMQKKSDKQMNPLSLATKFQRLLQKWRIVKT